MRLPFLIGVATGCGITLLGLAVKLNHDVKESVVRSQPTIMEQIAEFEETCGSEFPFHVSVAKERVEWDCRRPPKLPAPVRLPKPASQTRLPTHPEKDYTSRDRVPSPQT